MLQGKRKFAVFFWKHYKKVKRFVSFMNDLFSVLVIIMSLESVYRFKDLKLIKPWQLARLIERLPRLFNTVKVAFG